MDYDPLLGHLETQVIYLETVGLAYDSHSQFDSSFFRKRSNTLARCSKHVPLHQQHRTLGGFLWFGN